MHHHYSDITEPLGEPKWWDEHAVPRYCDFGPRETADIYADQVLLLGIECQSCQTRFKVAMSSHTAWAQVKGWATLRELVELNELHYGDPPNAGCCPAGPTMNSVPIVVLEFWQQDERFDFVRVPSLERRIDCDWASPASTGGEPS